MWTKDACIAFILILSALPRQSLCSYSDGVRLADGDTPFDGRPEVFIDKWRPFCDSYLHPNVAKVICRMLRMPTNNVTLKSSKYVNDWDTWIVCDESDLSLFDDCNWYLWPDRDCWQDLGLSCNGNIRLTDGTNDQNGNIEIFHNGNLTSICGHDSDFKVAQVVCRQLGLDIGRSALTLNSYFGPGLPCTVQVTCGGNEDSIEQCRFKETRASHNVLGVDCNATQYELEVLQAESDKMSINVNTYATSGYWTEKLTGVGNDSILNLKNIASVICYELGYSRYAPGVLEIPFDGRFAYPLQLSDAFLCSGLEDRLSECSIKDDLDGNPSSADNLTEIAITCNDNLKLHGGKNHYSGVLMQKKETDGTWQPFADIRPDYAMAIVACRELGYDSSNVEIQLMNNGGDAVDSIDVEYICSGGEKILRDCQTKHNNDRRSKAEIGLNCKATTVALTEINKRYGNGYVKRLFGQRADGQVSAVWSGVCTSETTFDVNTAAVICHQLGYIRYDAKLTLLPLTEDSSFFDDISRYACIGTEEYLSQCPIYGEFSQRKCRFDVSMTCQDMSSCTGTRIKMPSKAINCHNFHCTTSFCYRQQAFRRFDVPCLLDIGQGCMISKLFVKTATGSFLESMNGYCNPSCEAVFTKSITTYRSDECCYTEMCNTNTTIVRDKHYFRLIGGILPWEGFVQFFSNPDNKWVYIHDHTSVTNKIVEALCIGSGYFANSFARSPNTVKTDTYDEMCVLPGSEDGNCNVQDLTSDCFTSQKACPEKDRLRINCNAHAPKARLADGGSYSMGRVEIYFLNRWGTVCTKGISKGVSDVLCRSLGFNGGCSQNTTAGTNRALFPAGDGDIHFENVSCIGNEKSILQCNYSYVDETSECSHEDDFGIICEEGSIYSGEEGVEAISVRPETEESSTSFVEDELKGMSTSTGITENEGERNEFEHEHTTSFPSDSLLVFTCFEGQCEADDCLEFFMRLRFDSVCTANQSDNCYVEKRETNKRNEKVFKFGCTKKCINGVTQGSNGETKTRYCCASELCNINNYDALSQTTDNVGETIKDFTATENDSEWGADIFSTSSQETHIININGTNTTDAKNSKSHSVVNIAVLWMVLAQIVCLYMSSDF